MRVARWRWPDVVLTISALLVLFVLLFPDFLCAGMDPGTNPFLHQWLSCLATVALISTFLWSVVAWIGIYFGPHGLQLYSNALGPTVMLSANGLVFLAIIACVLGIVGVWMPSVYFHLSCIMLAEGFFWLYDRIVIKRLDQRLSELAEEKKQLTNETEEARKKGEAQIEAEKLWALDIRQRLTAWLQYVDRPATVAFLVLLGAMAVIEIRNFRISRLEIEILATGAVFFASMTANLAFYAANLPMKEQATSASSTRDEATTSP